MESAIRARAVGADAPAYTNGPAETEVEVRAGSATTLATIPVPAQVLLAWVSKSRERGIVKAGISFQTYSVASLA